MPGGSYLGSFQPVVSMSQNLLPFEKDEYSRFGYSRKTLRYLLLRFFQSNAFKKSKGVIFLTKYAQKVVEETTGKLANTAMIPHGISSKFFRKPKLQRVYEKGGDNESIKVLYVSIVNHYKHQWNVVKAIAMLRNRYKYSIELTLLGPNFPDAMKKLNAQCKISDSEGKWVKYIDAVPHDELPKYLFNSDIGIFASSCENLPIILLEKMASGLPIACSNKGPMPEILGDSAILFDPQDVEEIAESLCRLINSKDVREILASKSYEIAKSYSWEKCSHDTFQFLKKISLQHMETLKK